MRCVLNENKNAADVEYSHDRTKTARILKESFSSKQTRLIVQSKLPIPVFTSGLFTYPNSSVFQSHLPYSQLCIQFWR